jgi:hypothetical protein
MKNFFKNLYYNGPDKEQTTIGASIKHKSGQELQFYGVSAAKEGE